MKQKEMGSYNKKRTKCSSDCSDAIAEELKNLDKDGEIGRNHHEKVLHQSTALIKFSNFLEMYI